MQTAVQVMSPRSFSQEDRESGRNRAKMEGCSQKALKEILAADSQATAIPRFSSALLKWS